MAGDAKSKQAPKYERAQIERIRRAAIDHANRRGIGAPKFCREINAFHGDGYPSETYPLNLKTLQRFVTGRRIRNHSIKLIEDFVESDQPIDPIEILADATVSLFSQMFSRVVQDSGAGDGKLDRKFTALGGALASEFVASYDVFLEGQAMRRNSENEAYTDLNGVVRHGEPYIPIDPDRDYTFNRPFEIPYSRWELYQPPFADWLVVRESVINRDLRNVREHWKSGKGSEGVLIAIGNDSSYLAVLKVADSDEPKTYLLETDSNTHAEPRDKKCLIGVASLKVEHGYLTSFKAKTVMLVPTNAEKPPAPQM